jgi:hypothetical protein
MVINKGIELECFVEDSTTSTLSDLNIGFELASCDIELATFYSIDMISPYVDPYDNTKIYTEIYSGGISFICTLDYNSIKTKIENATKL